MWHPYHPSLYTLNTQVLKRSKVLDETSRQIGIRTIRYTAQEGFFLNGERLYIRGANRHQAFPYVGDAASNSMQVRDVINLKRGGYNAVRVAHYPSDPAFLEACDRYGLLVVECIPGWQFYNPDSIFIKRLYQVGRQMIRSDRNHPSVILWETALNESRYPVLLARKIQELPRLKIASVRTDGNQKGYPESNIIDNDDRTWWIAGDSGLPQTIIVSLEQPTYVTASRIVFQKDSSSYKHKVETSIDGEHWLELYQRECIGWEFKPMTVNREIKYLRLTIEATSEGRAGLGEISLY